MRVLGAVLSCVLLAAAPAAPAEIYKWTDEDGRVHYTQNPPPEDSTGSTEVEVLENRRRSGIELPPRALERYCGDVAGIAREIAVRLAEGTTLGSLRASANRSRLEGLANAVVSQVWDERSGESSPAALASTVHASCMNGAYTRYVKQYWELRYPDRPLPATADRDEGADPRQTKAGTGWAIGPRTIVTTLHVIAGRDTVEVVLGPNEREQARLVDVDAEHDLARLRLVDAERRLSPLPVSMGPARLGAKVLTIGYPHVNVMGRSPKVTTGVISARAGPRDDERLYQISAPVQAGNSGGPLFNERGEVIGVIAGKLDAEAVYQASGDMPQNVNYAIKSAYLRPWVTGAGSGAASAGELDTESLVSRVRDSVVMVVAR